MRMDRKNRALSIEEFANKIVRIIMGRRLQKESTYTKKAKPNSATHFDDKKALENDEKRMSFFREYYKKRLGQ